MTFHVTKTQKLIAEAALASVGGAAPVLRDPEIVELMVRAMVVIEKGRMQSYMLRGFDWSCRSRGPQNSLEVDKDVDDLTNSVELFHHHIENARGEAACRIRANRVRRIKEIEENAEVLQQLAAQQRHNLLRRLPRLNDREAANLNGMREPRRGLGRFH